MTAPMDLSGRAEAPSRGAGNTPTRPDTDTPMTNQQAVTYYTLIGTIVGVVPDIDEGLACTIAGALVRSGVAA